MLDPRSPIPPTPSDQPPSDLPPSDQPLGDPLYPPATDPTVGPLRTTRVAGKGVWRIGAVLALGIALVAGAAVVMGASPSPSGASPTATPSASTTPGTNGKRGGPWAGPAFGFGFRGGPMGPAAAGPAFGQITITAINGSSVSLQTADGWKRTITVTSSTKIMKGGTAISLSGLKVGDQVRLQESRSSNGTFTVTGIEVVLPTTAGTVTAKTSSSITIKLPDGSSQTLKVNGSTTYEVRGVQTASLSDITVGMQVIAQGTRNADGSFSASSVEAAGVKGGRFAPWGPGQREPAPTAKPSASPASNS